MTCVDVLVDSKEVFINSEIAVLRQLHYYMLMYLMLSLLGSAILYSDALAIVIVFREYSSGFQIVIFACVFYLPATTTSGDSQVCVYSCDN